MDPLEETANQSGYGPCRCVNVPLDERPTYSNAIKLEARGPGRGHFVQDEFISSNLRTNKAIGLTSLDRHKSGSDALKILCDTGLTLHILHTRLRVASRSGLRPVVSMMMAMVLLRVKISGQIPKKNCTVPLGVINEINNVLCGQQPFAADHLVSQPPPIIPDHNRCTIVRSDSLTRAVARAQIRKRWWPASSRGLVWPAVRWPLVAQEANHKHYDDSTEALPLRMAWLRVYAIS